MAMKAKLKYRSKLIKYLFSGFIWTAPLFLLFGVGLRAVLIRVECFTAGVKNGSVGFYSQVFVLGLIETAFLLLASLKSPGYCADMEGEEDVEKASLLNKSNSANAQRGSVCKQCGIKRPLRSCHCSECDRCIVRFDHHDVVINNCIGYGNQHYYVLFLIAAFVTSFVVVYSFLFEEVGAASLLGKLYGFVRILVVVRVCGIVNASARRDSTVS